MTLEKMVDRTFLRRWMVVAASIIAVTALIYAFGRPDMYTPLVVSGLLLASLGGYYFRANPDVRVWKFAYVMGFSCWVELAWLAVQLGLSAATPFGAYVRGTPAGPRFAFSFLPGYVGGGVVGYYVGRRRGFAPPVVPWWL